MFYLFLAFMLAASVAPATNDGPARAPQLAAGKTIVGLTFGAGKKIYFSVSHDAGLTFSPPVTVAQAEIVPLTRHRGPRIVVFGNTIVISAVMGKALSQGPHAHGLPSDGDLLCWRSVDGGKSWSKGIVVNDGPGAATEGLHSLAGDEKGNLFAAWLDKRNEKGTTLFGTLSNDGGLSWSKNVLIYQSPEGSICPMLSSFGSDGFRRTNCGHVAELVERRPRHVSYAVRGREGIFRTGETGSGKLAT